MGDSTRIMALLIVIVILTGTLLGSVLPELGNVTSHILDKQYIKPHDFNIYFLIIGIIGIGLALYLGHR